MALPFSMNDKIQLLSEHDSFIVVNKPISLSMHNSGNDEPLGLVSRLGNVTNFV